MEVFAHSIAYVDSSNAAIVCLTTSGLMLLYAKFKVKTIKKPIVHETVKHIAVVGGNPINANTQEKGMLKQKTNYDLVRLICFSFFVSFAASSAEPLEILALTQSDQIYLWSNNDQKYLRCFTMHSFSIKNIFWCDRKLLALASDGILYRGTVTRNSIESTSSRDSTEEFVEQKNRKVDISESVRCDIELTRIPNIDRITNVSVDQRGESYVILQENSKRYLTIPAIEDDPITFKSLLNETTEFDLLHDIVFHVSEQPTPFHIV